MTPEIGSKCPACLGRGVWEAECCSGYKGCSCKGKPVFMGACLNCGGTGKVDKDYSPGANVKSISGKMYLGTGPIKNTQ